MNRRSFLKYTAIGSGMLAMQGSGLFANPAEGSNSDSTKLTILYTNDVHSRIDPFPDNHPKLGGLGGFARRSQLIKRVREEGNQVLLLDAGDIFQGTPYFNFYGGELEYKLMTDMGYDATTLGNHDFDNGIDGIVKQLPNAGFAFISTNYNCDDTPLSKVVLPYKIYQKGKLKVGIYGLGIDPAGLIDKKLFGGVRYMDPLAESLKIEKFLKLDKKCDLVICLSHLGHSYKENKISDLTLAPQLFYTDLIIGGHTHTFLDHPVELLTQKMTKILVTQVGWAGVILGRIDYVYNTGKLASNPHSTMMKLSKKTIQT
jgi:5'-nucleotidase